MLVINKLLSFVDIVPFKSNNIDSYELDTHGLIEIKKRYLTLRTDVKKYLNTFTTPLIQKELREFHTKVWHDISVLRSEGVLSNDYEDIVAELFVFSDEDLNPIIDFSVLTNLKTRMYLLEPIKKVMMEYLDVLEKYKLPLLSSGPIIAEVHRKWVGSPTLIKEPVEI